MMPDVTGVGNAGPGTVYEERGGSNGLLISFEYTKTNCRETGVHLRRR